MPQRSEPTGDGHEPMTNLRAASSEAVHRFTMIFSFFFQYKQISRFMGIPAIALSQFRADSLYCICILLLYVLYIYLGQPPLGIESIADPSLSLSSKVRASLSQLLSQTSTLGTSNRLHVSGRELWLQRIDFFQENPLDFGCLRGTILGATPLQKSGQRSYMQFQISSMEFLSNRLEFIAVLHIKSYGLFLTRLHAWFHPSSFSVTKSTYMHVRMASSRQTRGNLTTRKVVHLCGCYGCLTASMVACMSGLD